MNLVQDFTDAHNAARASIGSRDFFASNPPAHELLYIESGYEQDFVVRIVKRGCLSWYESFDNLAKARAFAAERYLHGLVYAISDGFAEYAAFECGDLHTPHPF